MLKSLVKSDSDKSENKRVRASFYIHFAAEADLLPKLIQPFSNEGLIPDRIFCDREAHAERSLNLEVRLHEVESVCAKQLEEVLYDIEGVKTVIVVMENPC